MKCLLCFYFILLSSLSGYCHITGDSASCKGNQSIFTSSYTSSSNLWNVTGGSYSTQLNDSSYLVNWSSPGTYVVTLVSDSMGQIDTSVHTIVVHDIPYPYIKPLQSNTCLTANGLPFALAAHFASSSGNSPSTPGCYAVCDSGWYQYTVIGQPGSSYIWSSSTSDSISHNFSGDTISVHWTGHGDRTLYCTETNVYGCQNTTGICISVIGRPKACLTSFPSDSNGVIYLCRGSSVTFNDNCSSVPFGANIVSRVWDMGDGTVISNQTIVTHEYISAGTYQLKYFIQTNCYCADTFRLTVVVDTGKGPDIYCISTTCADSVALYFTHDSCVSGYQWSITGGDTLSGHGDTISVRWGNGNSGYGVVSLTTSCVGHCPYASKAYVPIVPKNAFINGPQVVCHNEQDLYSVPFVPSTIYEWYDPSYPSSLIGGSNSNELQWTWRDGAGTIDSIKVKYTNPFLLCGGLSSMPVYIARKYTITGANQACLGLPDTFRSLSDTIPIGCRWALYNYSGITRIDTMTGGAFYVPPFTAAGIYRLRAYPDTGYFCGSPQELLVTVYDLPSAPTNPIVGADTVCAGEIYTYVTSSSSSAYYLEWKTYNASPASASGNQIQLAWAAPFNDTLYVRNVMIDNPGCPSPWRKEVIYPLTNLHPTISGDTSSCSDQIKNYSTAFAADDYSWSIIPASAGSVATEQNTSAVSVQWNHTDTNVHARLIVQVKKCSQTIYDTIPVSIYAVPGLTLTIDSPICVGSAVNMSVSPTGSSVDWNFGDGSAHGAISPVTHSYSVDRSYSILVTVTSPGGCPVTVQAAKTVSVYPLPKAYFSTPDETYHCTHSGWSDTLYTTLQNMGSVGITYQLYNVGDTVGVASSSGTFIVTTAGSYFVQVTSAAGCTANTNFISVTDTCGGGGGGGCSTADTIGILESHDCGVLTLRAVYPPTARFDAWFIYDTALVMILTDTCTYAFKKAGFYQVQANGVGTYATDSCSIAARKKITIPLVPDFEVFYQCTGNVLQTKLVDISTYVLDSVSHWQWYVDDTVKSSIKNPLLTIAPGPHTIKLKVWNNRDTCEISKIDTVPAQPHASFTATDSTCSGNAIHFVSTSTPSVDIISYRWSYDDHTFSSLNPSDRAYTCTATIPCEYLPSLIIIDKYGCVDSTVNAIHIFRDALVTRRFCEVPDGILNDCLGKIDTLTIISVLTTTSSCTSIPQFVYEKYAWSNGAILYHNNQFPISQTGTYSVTVSDEYNCRKDLPAITTIFGNINAQITGDTIYCIGDKTFLNIFSGRNYTYSWLRKGGLSPDPPVAYNPSTDKPYLMKDAVDDLSDNNQYWGIVTDPTSGCSDTVGPVRIHVYGRVNAPFVATASSPCVSHGPVTLTISNAAADYFLWSNGVIGNSVVATSAGFYFINMIDTNGCDAGDTMVTIPPGPDFTQLISGCYDKCIGDTLIYSALRIKNATYHWLEDGVPLTSIYTLPLQSDLKVYGRSGHHVYRLDMELNGCRDTSDAIDIDFTLCPERNTCIDGDSTNISCQNCIEDTTNGEKHYNILLHMHYTGTTVANPIQVLSSYPDSVLTIDNFYPNYLNPISVNGGWNTLNISCTGYSPYQSSYDIVIRVSDACQYIYHFSPSALCRKH